MKRLINKKALLIRIGILRKAMYREAKACGYTHPNVVKISQKLDQLLNSYQNKVS